MLLAGFSVALMFTLPDSLNPFDSHGWFTHAVPMVINEAGLDMHAVEEGIHHAHHSAMLISLTVASIGIIFSILFYLLRVINADRVGKMANKLNQSPKSEISLAKYNPLKLRLPRSNSM